MQHEKYEPFESVPYNTRDGIMEDDRNSESSSGVREQVQAYTPQEYAPYEYGYAISSHAEKIMPRRSQRGWWAVVAITALLFFLLGGGMTTWLMTPTPRVDVVRVLPGPERVFPFEHSRYSWIAQSDIANALQLDPRQITMQLREGQSMAEIAAAEGVSATELRNIELKAFTDLFDAAVQSGDMDQGQADQWVQGLQNDSQLLNKMTIALFFADFDNR